MRLGATLTINICPLPRWYYSRLCINIASIIDVEPHKSLAHICLLLEITNLMVQETIAMLLWGVLSTISG